jgi:hypothetical protein
VLCTCCRHVRWINSTLGIAHLLLTAEGSWQDAAEVQGHRFPDLTNGRTTPST